MASRKAVKLKRELYYKERLREVLLAKRGVCMNCGELGRHFVPPSFGEAGFFACEKKNETRMA